MEMEQLLSMGFSSELASQALAATGGKSTLKATEWILSHEPPPSTSTSTATVTASASASAAAAPSQPKLDRYFNLNQKASSSQTIKTPTNKSNDNTDRTESPPNKRQRSLSSHLPLYERMRPKSINDVVGQDHILGPTSLLRSSINSNRLPSILLWGPPGTGKTSIAKSIVNSLTDYKFVYLSAVTCGVKDVKEAVDNAKKSKGLKRTVLCVDEVHRFNKSQQDTFLPVIEDGSIVFIGATTENPSFHLVTPLLSRCRVLTLNPLKPQDVEVILRRAIDDEERGLTKSLGVGVGVSDGVVEFLASNCDGDARVAMNVLEISGTKAVARSSVNGDGERKLAIVTLDDAKEAFQSKHVAYDRDGEEHYNLISALHKSMRGSDADASIYWLARMLEGGEQPLYIARRLVRFASEDVGLADPLALNQAVSCYQACHFLGMPECDVILAQCVAYLALAPKSIAVYRAFGAAQKVVKDSVGGNEGVPLHLRNAPTRLMKEIGYGKGYIYTPDDPYAPQSFLPPSLHGFKFLDWPPSGANDR